MEIALELISDDISYVEKPSRKQTMRLRLAEHMAAHKQTDATLAEALETTPPTVWRWRVGERRPHDSYLAKIAFLFGCTPIDLFSPPPEPAARPSIDAKVAPLPEDVQDQIHKMVDILIKTAQR